MTRHYLALAAIATLSLSGCQFLFGSYKTTTKIEGSIHEKRYSHPDGLFSMAVPDLYSQGALIQDDYESGDGWVVFGDDFGQFVRVDVATARTSEAIDKLRQPDWEAQMNDMHAHHLEEIRKSGFDIKEIHREFIDWRDNHVLFAVLDVPKGSTMARKELLGATRLDAIRFFLNFVEGNTIYLLWTQYTPDLFGNRDSMPPMQDIIEREKVKLIKLAETMRFNDGNQ